MINATGTATGLTWENAFTNLQEALSIVIPGDEIWVAAGQYKPTSGTSRTISFALRNGVNLFGGFAGDEMTISERDIASNPTVLNGDIGEPGSSSDNSYTVVRAVNINTSIVLDGFRIMNGYSNDTGGGLRITSGLGGNLLIRNCFVLNNRAFNYGGGLYMASANIRLENCEFYGNTGETGGAICNGNNNGGSSSLVAVDCLFRNNEAYQGACYYTTVSSDLLVFDRCVVTNNLSDNTIIEIDGTLDGRLLNCLIAGNTVESSSGKVALLNTTYENDSVLMINCTVTQNFKSSSSIQSEMIKIYGSHHAIRNCIIHGNTAMNGRQVSTNAVVSNSLVQGGHIGGTNIIDMDPEFSSPFQGIPVNFDASSYDYTLQTTSPAVNVGSNAVVVAPYDLDLALLPRIQGGIVDLGCYETDQTVAIAEAPAVALWYYDAFNRELRMAGATDRGNTVAQLHDLQGKIIATLTVRGQRHRIDLPAGAYVLSNPERGTLRFVVP